MGEAEIETEAAAILNEDEVEGKRDNHPMEKSRKEKRKEIKKMKRKQLRKEAATKEREAEEARLNDPEEQKRIAREEEEERKRREIALREFEARERALIEAMEIKRKAQEDEEEEERRRNDLKEDENEEQLHQEEMDDDWEYVEEGPAVIVCQGNEITFSRKKVRVPKGRANQKSKEEDADRPTSNPLPPQSEAFSDYMNGSSAQQVLESVAKEVPNFGTEQDKAHCPFHLKTGACRFGPRCSRVHFYPDKSCTLLLKNMYNGPGLAFEQDEGLEVCKRCLQPILVT